MKNKKTAAVCETGLHHQRVKALFVIIVKNADGASGSYVILHQFIKKTVSNSAVYFIRAMAG